MYPQVSSDFMTSFPPSGGRPDSPYRQVLRHADLAMHTAKERGKNGLALLEDSMGFCRLSGTLSAVSGGSLRAWPPPGRPRCAAPLGPSFRITGNARSLCAI